MKKLLLTCTDLMAIQFFIEHIKYWAAEGFQVDVVCSPVGNRSEELKQCLKTLDRVSFRLVNLSRNPLRIKNVKGFFQVKKIIKTGQYDCIITNEPVMGFVTRLAACFSLKSKAKIIYIAHGFHFFKGAPLKNWIIYYPIEKVCSFFTDVLITINHEDFYFAQQKFKVKTKHIFGIGVSTERFRPGNSASCRAMRQKENLHDTDFVLLCVGELNQNKNQITLLEAVRLLKDQIPELCLLFAGKGAQEETLKKRTEEYNLTKQVRFLGYRKDLEQITPAADLIVSCSLREGLPLNVLEAMLCKKAVVASVNRGHNELIQHGVTGYLVSSPKNPAEYAEKIKSLYHDREKRLAMGEAGFLAAQKYTLQPAREALKKIITQ